MIDDMVLAGARIYAIPMSTRFRGITLREGMLIEGLTGWGEFCPFPEYDDREAAPWLATAVEQVTWAGRSRCGTESRSTAQFPAVGPQRAHEITAQSGCRTAKIKLADHLESLAEDIVRVEAVRDALGPDGAIRVDANGVWDVDTAVRAIRLLDQAAGGLEYVEQPCRTFEEPAAVRRLEGLPTGSTCTGRTRSSALGDIPTGGPAAGDLVARAARSGAARL